MDIRTGIYYRAARNGGAETSKGVKDGIGHRWRAWVRTAAYRGERGRRDSVAATMAASRGARNGDIGDAASISRVWRSHLSICAGAATPNRMGIGGHHAPSIMNANANGRASARRRRIISYWRMAARWRSSPLAAGHASSSTTPHYAFSSHERRFIPCAPLYIATFAERTVRPYPLLRLSLNKAAMKASGSALGAL